LCSKKTSKNSIPYFCVYVKGNRRVRNERIIKDEKGVITMCKHGRTEIVELNKPCPSSGRLFVPVDACIAKDIQNINDRGITTVGSCCGHGAYRPYVLIEEESLGIALAAGYEIRTYDYRQGVYQILLQNNWERRWMVITSLCCTAGVLLGNLLKHIF